VSGGGHDWFGVWGNQDIQATELLWDFFASHCSGEFSGGSNSIANAPSAESLLAFWNGEHVGILADSDLIAWDVHRAPSLAVEQRHTRHTHRPDPTARHHDAAGHRSPRRHPRLADSVIFCFFFYKHNL
jgi:hypothetical protein